MHKKDISVKDIFFKLNKILIEGRGASPLGMTKI
jgi:hypothetical protein